MKATFFSTIICTVFYVIDPQHFIICYFVLIAIFLIQCANKFEEIKYDNKVKDQENEQSKDNDTLWFKNFLAVAEKLLAD